MELAIITLALLTGVATVLIVGGRVGAYPGHHSVAIPNRPTSPMDEAERILATRYARGEITPDEYSRMLAVLRR